MPLGTPAKLLRIHLGESDRWQGRPLFEAIVDKCREYSIAGATVFRGLEGYGGSAGIRRHHLMGRDQPLMIHVVDSAEKIEALLPVLEAMLDRGMLAISDVEAVRVCHTGDT